MFKTFLYIAAPGQIKNFFGKQHSHCFTSIVIGCQFRSNDPLTHSGLKQITYRGSLNSTEICPEQFLLYQKLSYICIYATKSSTFHKRISKKASGGRQHCCILMCWLSSLELRAMRVSTISFLIWDIALCEQLIKRQHKHYCYVYCLLHYHKQRLNETPTVFCM